MKKMLKSFLHKAIRPMLTIMFVVMMLLTLFSVLGAITVTGTGFFDLHNRECVTLLMCAAIYLIISILCAWNGILK